MDQYLVEAREMIMIKEQKSRLEDREKGLKKTLMGFLAQYGEPYGPSGQHTTVPFPEPIRNYLRAVRQARTSNVVDTTKAEAIARNKNLYETLFKPVMTLDQDAVLVAREQGLLTDDDLDEIFSSKTTYAFVLEKSRS